MLVVDVTLCGRHAVSYCRWKKVGRENGKRETVESPAPSRNGAAVDGWMDIAGKFNCIESELQLRKEKKKKKKSVNSVAPSSHDSLAQTRDD
jgi:hypothetical protein